MSNSELHKPGAQITYTDGGSLTSICTDAGQSGEETITNIISGLAAALNQTICARTKDDPEYAAAKTELEATPWYRFNRRRKLSDRVSKLHFAAFQAAIRGTVGSLEIVDFENEPDAIDE